METLAALNDMASNFIDTDEKFEPGEDEIARWQKLFGYTYHEAAKHITDQRNDYSRIKVSDELWRSVKSEEKAQGYSREAYEHKIKKYSRPTSSHDQRSITSTFASRANLTYLVQLEGMLNTTKKIQVAAKLPDPPQSLPASSESGGSIFCRIDGNVKQAIEKWLLQQNSSFRATFVRISQARKDLAVTSMHPTLGIDSTLPQHRPSCSQASFLPLQDQYPVWYFFYGTLADIACLQSVLGLPETEHSLLVPATISGGIIKTWQGKYNALVDGPSTAPVNGSAYEVTTKEREDALRVYETENYDVVRCSIMMESGTVQGLTFRFIGSL